MNLIRLFLTRGFNNDFKTMTKSLYGVQCNQILNLMVKTFKTLFHITHLACRSPLLLASHFGCLPYVYILYNTDELIAQSCLFTYQRTGQFGWFFF